MKKNEKFKKACRPKTFYYFIGFQFYAISIAGTGFNLQFQQYYHQRFYKTNHRLVHFPMGLGNWRSNIYFIIGGAAKRQQQQSRWQ